MKIIPLSLSKMFLWIYSRKFSAAKLKEFTSSVRKFSVLRNKRSKNTLWRSDNFPFNKVGKKRNNLLFKTQKAIQLQFISMIKFWKRVKIRSLKFFLSVQQHQFCELSKYSCSKKRSISVVSSHLRQFLYF